MNEKKLFPSQSIEEMIKNQYVDESYQLVDSLEAGELIKYSKIADLLKISLAGVKSLINDDKKNISCQSAATWYGSVVSYINIFNSSKGRRKTLDYKTVFRNKKDREYHKEIDELRDEFVAHSGFNSLEDGKVTIASDKKIIVFSHRQATPPKESLQIFLDLIYKVAEHVDEKMAVLREKVEIRIQDGS